MASRAVAPATIIKNIRPQFETAAEAGGGLVVYEQEALFAVQAMERNTLLTKCTPASLKHAVLDVAAMGLTLNPAKQHAALVPRKVRKGRDYVWEACLEPMYRGLISVATKSGAVKSVWGHLVREDDVHKGNFTMELGTEPSVTFNPNPLMSPQQRGPIVGAYVCADIEGSERPHVTWMRVEEINRIRNGAESYKNYAAKKAEFAEKGYWTGYGGKQNKKPPHPVPWEYEEEGGHYGQMALKTVFKRAQKTWSSGDDGRLAKAVEMANYAEGYGYIEPDERDLPGEAEPVAEPITQEQARELRNAARKARLRVEMIYPVYDISKMEELPSDKLAECRHRIHEAHLFGTLKRADEDTVVKASDWDVTLSQLKQKAREAASKAVLEE